MLGQLLSEPKQVTLFQKAVNYGTDPKTLMIIVVVPGQSAEIPFCMV